jgi:hypothetical protein
VAIQVNLDVDQGATFSTTISITGDNGEAANLSGYTANAQMRKSYSTSTYIAFTTSIDGANGIISLTMPSATTANTTAGRYVYDVKMTETSSSTVTRVVEGIVTVTPNVTR